MRKVFIAQELYPNGSKRLIDASDAIKPLVERLNSIYGYGINVVRAMRIFRGVLNERFEHHFYIKENELSVSLIVIITMIPQE